MVGLEREPFVSGADGILDRLTADAVAGTACTLAGAHHGYSKLPTRLVADLEYHDCLLHLADGLFEPNRSPVALREVPTP